MTDKRELQQWPVEERHRIYKDTYSAYLLAFDETVSEKYRRMLEGLRNLWELSAADVAALEAETADKHAFVRELMRLYDPGGEGTGLQ